MTTPRPTDRQLRMTTAVFKSGNCRLIADGVRQLMEVMENILEGDTPSTLPSPADIRQRLDAVDSKVWRSIRNSYLVDPLVGYCNGNFTPSEQSDVSKILIDFISVVEKLRETVTDKVAMYSDGLAQARRERQEAEGKLLEVKTQQMEDLRHYNVDKAELKTVKASMLLLENTIKEKNDRIAELQRCENIRLWEREKEKITKDSQEKIKLLEELNEDLRRNNESLMKKYHIFEDQNKLLKMKTERSSGDPGALPGNSNPAESVPALKRKNFLMERDVMYLERELYNHQKLVVGILSGLRKDADRAAEPLRDPQTDVIRDRNFRELLRRIDTLSSIAAEGLKPQDVKDKLPEEYQYTNQNIKLHRVMRLSIKPGQLPPVNREPPADVKLEPEDVAACKPDATDSASDAAATNGEEVKVVNPSLVVPGTKQLDHIKCLRHFPHLNQEFIKDHWEKFQELDNNGDMSLDFSEVVKALTAMGLKFSASQVEEAVDEVDVDQSRTLDFYEYVLVAEKLLYRTGQSQLFKTDVAKSENKVMAKTCVVQ